MTGSSSERTAGAASLDFSAVAGSLASLEPYPRSWPVSGAKVVSAGPLADPVHAYLSQLAPFVHVLSEDEDSEEATYKWLITVAWILCVATVVLSGSPTQLDPRIGGALHQLCKNWLDDDYILFSSLSWNEMGDFESEFQDNWARIDAESAIRRASRRFSLLQEARPEVPSGSTFVMASIRLVNDTVAVLNLNQRAKGLANVRAWVTEPAEALGLPNDLASRPRTVLPGLRAAIEEALLKLEPAFMPTSDTEAIARASARTVIFWAAIDGYGSGPYGRNDQDLSVSRLWQGIWDEVMRRGDPEIWTVGWPARQFRNSELLQDLPLGVVPDWIVDGFKSFGPGETQLADPLFRRVSMSALLERGWPLRKDVEFLQRIWSQWDAHLSESPAAMVDGSLAGTRQVEEMQANLSTDLHSALDDLIGLASVKRDVEELASFQRIQAERKAAGLPVSSVNRHLVFSGNPGTGKTTVARLIGKIYHSIGLLPTDKVLEVTRSDLVGTYLGETAPKVTAAVHSALGGVLFIDEAYSLSPRTDGGSGDLYGSEAIDTLNKLMEDYRDDVVVIVAGYTDRMHEFLDSNPGLASRFTRTLVFDDYTPSELAAIYEGICLEAGYTMTSEALTALRRYLSTMKRPESFGNGRYVRSLFEDTLVRQSVRLASQADRGLEDLSTILPDDLPLDVGRVAESSDDLADALAELDALIGLASLKSQVRELVDTLKIQRLRKDAGLPSVNWTQHLVFSGSPGTGKTTVARILARIYGALGFVSRGHIVECARADLVAGYVGQTAIKTTRKVKSALGGVLFIDEAYTLTKDSGGSSPVGSEAIDTLLKLMEDYRDDLVVIAAGYPDEMVGFINANPGLASRFTEVLTFPDYEDSELTEIFYGMASSAHIVMSPDADRLVGSACSMLRQRSDFANARSVRTLFQQVLSAQAVRLAKGTPSMEQLTEVTSTDIEKAIARQKS